MRTRINLGIGELCRTEPVAVDRHPMGYFPECPPGRCQHRLEPWLGLECSYREPRGCLGLHRPKKEYDHPVLRAI